MSWLFSRVLVAACSAHGSLDGEQCAPSNTTNTPEMYLLRGKTTEASKLSRFGMTCKPLTDDRGEELLTSYLAAFPAKTSVPQARAQESTESVADCGAKWRALSMRYDPDTSGWKTHLCLWEEDLPLSLVTLPKWGMTQNGELWERTTQEPDTSVTGVGYWRTPDTGVGGDLPGETIEKGFVRPSGAKAQMRLQDQVKHPQTWPTPQASDNKDRGCLKDNVIRKRMVNGKQVNLSMCVSVQSGRLNPDWVEWLMGWPVGWTSLAPLKTTEPLPWHTDPADTGDIPRVTEENNHRAQRLMRIGNGQVPQALAQAWRELYM